jgi:hypothetical protein
MTVTLQQKFTGLLGAYVFVASCLIPSEIQVHDAGAGAEPVHVFRDVHIATCYGWQLIFAICAYLLNA